QAEDGIRDGHVTGVQTCALPILHPAASTGQKALQHATQTPLERRLGLQVMHHAQCHGLVTLASRIEPEAQWRHRTWAVQQRWQRSEERRVGKERRSWRTSYHWRE